MGIKERTEEQYRKDSEKELRAGMLDLFRIGKEINRWRHDILGELTSLLQMLKNGKYGAVETQMEKMCGILTDYPEFPQPTGNEGLDAALIKAVPRCREQGISFYYSVLGRLNRVDSIDFGVLMDNLLNNAIEACQKVSSDKLIDLTVRDMETGMVLYLTNSISESVLKDNPELKSHKQEHEQHGFGIESIRRIVGKYSGTYEYWEEDAYFCQKIYLKMSESDVRGT